MMAPSLTQDANSGRQKVKLYRTLLSRYFLRANALCGRGSDSSSVSGMRFGFVTCIESADMVRVVSVFTRAP